MVETTRVAVLVDCDNISPRAARAVFAETAKHGTLSIKRGYGDWASSELTGWRREVSKHAIQPIQQFAHRAGKNATDSALIIDAMDLLYSGNIDTFCIVSSDSDFTSLAMRLRASGRTVYGIGSKLTHYSFRNACDRFTFIEVLAGESIHVGEEAEAPPDETPVVLTTEAPVDPSASDPEATAETTLADEAVQAAEPTVPELKTMIEQAIEASAKESGWAILASVGWYIVNNNPSFDSRNYGYPRLGALVRDLPDVEVKELIDGNGFAQLWVRLRTGGSPSAP